MILSKFNLSYLLYLYGANMSIQYIEQQHEHVIPRNCVVRKFMRVSENSLIACRLQKEQQQLLDSLEAKNNFATFQYLIDTNENETKKISFLYICTYI